VTQQPLPIAQEGDCWNRIGVWGDRSCPELIPAVHCHNCPVFAAASRRFLDNAPPPGYLEEWTERLITPIEEEATDLQSVLIFRLREEWLALRVEVLLEVTTVRPVHRVPHRMGLLAGLVNIRGELHLCVHLAQLLGANGKAVQVGSVTPHTEDQRGQSRMIVVEHDGDRWVFPVDEVDQVYRLSKAELAGTPATLARSANRLTESVFTRQERSIGLLQGARLFQMLRAKIK
jgi:chemotaxis-related protein WspD